MTFCTRISLNTITLLLVLVFMSSFPSLSLLLPLFLVRMCFPEYFWGEEGMRGIMCTCEVDAMLFGIGLLELSPDGAYTPGG